MWNAARPRLSSRVPTLICHREEHSDVAISMRLNFFRRTAVATATTLLRYACNDKVGAHERAHRIDRPQTPPLPRRRLHNLSLRTGAMRQSQSRHDDGGRRDTPGPGLCRNDGYAKVSTGRGPGGEVWLQLPSPDYVSWSRPRRRCVATPHQHPAGRPRGPRNWPRTVAALWVAGSGSCPASRRASHPRR